MPPIPPMPPLGMAGASLFGCSVIVASVVTIKPAIDAASCADDLRRIDNAELDKVAVLAGLRIVARSGEKKDIAARISQIKAQIEETAQIDYRAGPSRSRVIARTPACWKAR